MYRGWIEAKNPVMITKDSKLRNPEYFLPPYTEAKLRVQLVQRVNKIYSQRKSRLLARMGLTGTQKKLYVAAGGTVEEVQHIFCI